LNHFTVPVDITISKYCAKLAGSVTQRKWIND